MRHLLSPAGVDEDAVEFLRRHGAPAAEIEAAQSTSICHLWPEHEAPLRLFAACATQWRWAGAGHLLLRTGLDYSAVEVAARHSGIELTPALFADLQTCELAALEIYGRERR